MLTTFQRQLFDDLTKLVNENDAFYFQDFDLDGSVYRIFNYRLASYTDFLLPGAMECRGVMFEVDGDQAVRLAALPMQKFFNLHENPMTMDLDLSTVVEVQDKVDGSLISTYMHNGDLRLKSKGSLFSDQALAAMKWLDRKENAVFKDALVYLTGELEFTVNLEWVSPEHRIVVGYLDPQLFVLNVRNKAVGHYMTDNMFVMNRIEPFIAKKVDVKGDIVEFVNSISDMTDDIEGYIIKLASGQWVKVKTQKYLSLHHAKDSVNNPRRLFEVILDEGIDDIRSMFYTDVVAMKMIDEMEVRVDKLYNSMVKTVEQFYQDNKDLDRKEFAIKGQKELDRMHFGLVMNKYIGKSIDYKQFLKSKWKELGFRDEKVED